jgi:hypothetical protein
MNLESIIDILEVLSDKTYQTDLWTGNLKDEQSSFTEAVCILFDDSGLGIELDSGVFEINHSPELYRSICQFRMLVRDIDDSGSPEQTLKNPKMQEIRDAAAMLKKLFS